MKKNDAPESILVRNFIPRIFPKVEFAFISVGRCSGYLQVFANAPTDQDNKPTPLWRWTGKGMRTDVDCDVL